jgi:hypothetical protein
MAGAPGCVGDPPGSLPPPPPPPPPGGGLPPPGGGGGGGSAGGGLTTCTVPVMFECAWQTNEYVAGVLKVQFPLQAWVVGTLGIGRFGGGLVGPDVCVQELGCEPPVKVTLWALPPAASLKNTVPPVKIDALFPDEPTPAVRVQKLSPAVKVALCCCADAACVNAESASARAAPNTSAAK